MNISVPHTLKTILLMLISSILAGGCVGGITNTLSETVLSQNDAQTVRDGAPAFMLMVDTMILRDPDDEDILLAGAKLYGAYAAAFVDEPERTKRLTKRAYDYARRSLCEELEEVCEALQQSSELYQSALNEIDDEDDLPYLYGFATSWASWVQANSEDWNAIADLPKIEAAMHKVVELDDRYDNGNAHLYLGVLNTQLPLALGGKPEVGRMHFERAILIAEGRNLMAKVFFAKQYARLIFDKQLHDRLLREVLNAPAEAAGFTLINTIAQQRAKLLLAESDEFF